MEYIIKTLHLLFYLLIALSPFINNCELKINICVILLFLLFQFTTKYGKCGIINIERFFLKENYKKGFCYNLIKPVIDYRKNIFFDKLYHLIIIYILILSIQIYQNNCINIIYQKIVFINRNKN